jgi:hypothetical protein
MPLFVGEIDSSRNHHRTKEKKMANKIRRTEIQIETHEVEIIRHRGKRFSVYCERCEAMTSAFTLGETAAFFATTLTDICRRIGADKFHLVSSIRGVPLICGSSLGSENKRMLKASPNQI